VVEVKPLPRASRWEKYEKDIYSLFLMPDAVDYFLALVEEANALPNQEL